MEPHGVHELSGFFGVWVGALTPERVVELVAAAVDYPVCVDGYEPDEYVMPGPQPSGGDGWRYLGAYDRVSVGREPRVAASPAEFSRLWKEMGVNDPAPVVDFSSEIVVTFEVSIPFGPEACTNVRLDDVVVDGQMLYPVGGGPPFRRAIGTDPPANCVAFGFPRTYLVAVSRSLLPEPPFTITVDPEYSAGIVVDADLRQPPA